MPQGIAIYERINSGGLDGSRTRVLNMIGGQPNLWIPAPAYRSVIEEESEQLKELILAALRTSVPRRDPNFHGYRFREADFVVAKNEFVCFDPSRRNEVTASYNGDLLRDKSLAKKRKDAAAVRGINCKLERAAEHLERCPHCRWSFSSIEFGNRIRITKPLAEMIHAEQLYGIFASHAGMA